VLLTAQAFRGPGSLVSSCVARVRAPAAQEPLSGSCASKRLGRDYRPGLGELNSGSKRMRLNYTQFQTGWQLAAPRSWRLQATAQVQMAHVGFLIDRVQGVD
jgi:hypothetical protein